MPTISENGASYKLTGVQTTDSYNWVEFNIEDRQSNNINTIVFFDKNQNGKLDQDDLRFEYSANVNATDGDPASQFHVKTISENDIKNYGNITTELFTEAMQHRKLAMNQLLQADAFLQGTCIIKTGPYSQIWSPRVFAPAYDIKLKQPLNHSYDEPLPQNTSANPYACDGVKVEINLNLAQNASSISADVYQQYELGMAGIFQMDRYAWKVLYLGKTSPSNPVKIYEDSSLENIVKADQISVQYKLQRQIDDSQAGVEYTHNNLIKPSEEVLE